MLDQSIRKNVLPVVYPPLTTLPGYAHALAILLNYEKTYDWIYSHYIQIFAVDKLHREKNEPDSFGGSCFCDFDSRRIATIGNDFNFLKRDGFCPFLNTYEIGNDLLASLDIPFLTYIKHCINTSMYVYTYLDVSLIKQYKQTKFNSHPVFIYGYDEDQKLIYFADFPNGPSWRYNFSTCSYKEIEDAYASTQASNWPPVKSTAAIQYIDIMDYYLDYEYIRSTVRDYLYPSETVAERFNEFITSLYGPKGWKTKVYLGIDFYTYLADFLDREVYLGSDFFDFRLFHSFYDHKEMMIKRLEYLTKKGCFAENKSEYIESYQTVRDGAMNIRNMLLKYNVTKNNALIDKIKNCLIQTKELEANLLCGIFDL